MIARLLVVRLLLCAAPAAIQAQAQRRGAPQEAVEPLREAVKLLETIRSSNLEPGWRANACARLARALARVGDGEAARAMSTNALAATDEPSKTPTPAAVSKGLIFALLVQTYVDLRDPHVAQRIAQ